MKKLKIYDERYYNSAAYIKDLLRRAKLHLKLGTYAKNDFDKLFVVEQKKKKDEQH